MIYSKYLYYSVRVLFIMAMRLTDPPLTPSLTDKKEHDQLEKNLFTFCWHIVMWLRHIFILDQK